MANALNNVIEDVTELGNPSNDPGLKSRAFKNEIAHSSPALKGTGFSGQDNKTLYMGFGDWLIDEEIDNQFWE